MKQPKRGDLYKDKKSGTIWEVVFAPDVIEDWTEEWLKIRNGNAAFDISPNDLIMTGDFEYYTHPPLQEIKMRNKHNPKLLVLLNISLYVTPVLLLIATSIALKLKEHSENWYFPLLGLLFIAFAGLFQFNNWLTRKESRAKDEWELRSSEVEAQRKNIVSNGGVTPGSLWKDKDGGVVWEVIYSDVSETIIVCGSIRQKIHNNKLLGSFTEEHLNNGNN